MIRSLLSFAAVLLVVACSSDASSSGAARAAAPSRALEAHALDLDGDGTADSIIAVRADSAHAGQTGRIELHLSHAGERVLEDTARWEQAPDEFNGNGNLLQSRLLYVADFEHAGRLLFLFGAHVGCCQQSLTIYKLGANGPEPYFSAPEFFVDRSPVPQAGKVATIAGRTLSEAVAPPSSEFVSAVSYAPVTVYRLDTKPTLDSAATKALTREELGGFAGYAPRRDVAAVNRRDGSKAVWSFSDRRVLP